MNSPSPTENKKNDTENGYSSLADSQKDLIVVDAIEIARKQLVLSPEEFIKGWLIISVNQWNKEQERLLLVSSTAIYRVKFDFSTRKVIHFQRTPHSDMYAIHKGYIVVDTFTAILPKNVAIRGEFQDDGHAAYGVRIYENSNKSYNPFAKNQPFRTYCTELKGNSGKGIMNDIVNCIVAARKASFSSDNIVLDCDIVVFNHVPPVAALHNKMGLGLCLKNKQSDD